MAQEADEAPVRDHELHHYRGWSFSPCRCDGRTYLGHASRSDGRLAWIQIAGRKRLGMPSSANGHGRAQQPAPGTQSAVFPPVLGDENPSDKILKYLDGLTKKSNKIVEPRTEIPPDVFISLIKSLLQRCTRVVTEQFRVFFILPVSRTNAAIAKELKNKYEAIPADDRTVAQTGLLGLTCVEVIATLRYLGKLDLKIMDLEKIHAEINDIYASGAVEGYSEERPGFNAWCL